MKRVFAFFAVVLSSVVLASCFVSTKPIDEEKLPVKDDSEIIDETPKVPEEPEFETVTLTLYFPDNDALFLHEEFREVQVHKGEFLAPTVLEELFKGPVDENLSPCLDGKDLVNSVNVHEGLCTVDFKEDFAILNSGGSARETFVIGSIVNSLCELEGVDRVKINIGGNDNAVYGGHFTLEAPFAPQSDLVAKPE